FRLCSPTDRDRYRTSLRFFLNPHAMVEAEKRVRLGEGTVCVPWTRKISFAPLCTHLPLVEPPSNGWPISMPCWRPSIERLGLIGEPREGCRRGRQPGLVTSPDPESVQNRAIARRWGRITRMLRASQPRAAPLQASS